MSAVLEEGIRWSLTNAATEFGCVRETLKRGFKQNGIDADAEDGKFTTAQVCQALFGDLTGEKVRLTRAQADRVEMENKQAAKVLINVDDAILAVHQFTFAIRQKILLSGLTEHEKNNLLLELQRIGEMDFNKIGEDDVETSKVAG